MIGRECADCARPLRRADERPDDAPGTVRFAARGLCTGCWQSASVHDRLPDHPRVYRSRDLLLEDVRVMHRDGVPAWMMAGRLQMTPGAFARAIYRARRAGDSRAFIGQLAGMRERV